MSLCREGSSDKDIRRKNKAGERSELVQGGKTGPCFCMCNTLVLVLVQQFVALGLSHSLVCFSIKWLQL